jgi:DNA helicase-2/ATP-dependent DNA helicase PcrA
MDFLSGLNPQQREAVEHFEGPLLILAGAGSGKTRVITHRICHLIKVRHVPGASILAVTFTNKAAGEMKERVMKLLGAASGVDAPTVSTFHSFCVRVLRRDGDALAQIRPGFTRNFQIYDDDDQLAIVKRIFKKLGLDEEFMKYRSALSAISQGKNRKMSPEDFYKAATNPQAERLAKVYEEFEEELRKANALDFDDLLLETVRLLRHDAVTRDWYGRRYQFLMIDEYQDTNRSQYELMRLLTTRHSNVAVVGDEDQSIYGWRGADIKNILDFEKDFPGAKVIRLEQNYRSTKTILEAAGAVVAHNVARKGKWLWTESDAGAPICLFEAADGEQEALYIAEAIDKTLKREPMTRIAVLYRTNFQSRQIEEALRRYGRKYKVVGGLSFYNRAEVKDALAYLKLLLNPKDNVGLLRVLNVPARGIGKTTVEQIEKLAREQNISLWETIAAGCDDRRFGARADASLGAFRRIIDGLRENLENRPPDETLKQILEKSGYARMLETDPSPEAEGRRGNLQELVSAAADATQRSESVEEFLDHAALVSDSDDVDEKAQISLLTIHNAKGLEFPVVFIAGMEEGLFPHSRSRDNEEQLEEERRLCYVAMTRAEKRLYLSHAKSRRKYGGSPPEPCTPSRFLNEVPAQLIENLTEDRTSAFHVDLYGERQMVREVARRNTYTGKTYNSLDHISQFFSERGIPTPATRPSGQGSGAPLVPMPPRRPEAAAPIAPPGRPAVGESARRPSSQGALFSMPPVQPQTASTLRPPLTGAGSTGATPHAAGPPRFIAPKPPTVTSMPPAAPKRGGGVRAGATVAHPKYGKGLVLRKEGDGDEAKITVSFPGHGLKKLVAKYASLKVVD